MKAWDRLHRKVPGEHLADPSGVEVALSARAKEPPPTRQVAGEAIKAIEIKERRPKRIVEAQPNAPLLKRIVRFPKKYEQPMQGRKSVYREKLPWELLNRERTVGAFEFYVADRVTVHPEPPIPVLRELRNWARPKLSADAWLDSVGGDR